MKKLALHWQILIGMIAGILFGWLISGFEFGPGFVKNWIKPIGTIFINLLKLIAIPLIIASLIKGISDLKDISKFSLIGGRTIVIYILTTVVAISIGLLIVNIVQPGNSISAETLAELTSAFKEDAGERVTKAQMQKNSGPLQFIVDMVPSNIFGAASSNGNMLQVITFVVFFGISLLLVKPEQAAPVKSFFDSLNEVIMKMVDLIMLMAPYAVFALLASLVAETSNPDLLKALAKYALTVVMGLSLMVCVYFCLLYTSPSPRDATLSRMPSSA